MTSSPDPAGAPAGAAPAHPLDPLTAGEIRQAAAILRRERGVGPGSRFASIELREPGKDALRALAAGSPACPWC
jgi:primary-amine oxidase